MFTFIFGEITREKKKKNKQSVMKILSAGINPTMNAKNMFYNVISQMLFYKTPLK